MHGPTGHSLAAHRANVAVDVQARFTKSLPLARYVVIRLRQEDDSVRRLGIDCAAMSGESVPALVAFEDSSPILDCSAEGLAHLGSEQRG